jgi:hypothetical protein
MKKINFDIVNKLEQPVVKFTGKDDRFMILVHKSIEFTSREMEQLEKLNLDEYLLPVTHESNGEEIRLINSELINYLPEKELKAKFEYLENELIKRADSFIQKLIEEFDFELIR